MRIVRQQPPAADRPRHRRPGVRRPAIPGSATGRTDLRRPASTTQHPRHQRCVVRQSRNRPTRIVRQDVRQPPRRQQQRHPRPAAPVRQGARQLRAIMLRIAIELPWPSRNLRPGNRKPARPGPLPLFTSRSRRSPRPNRPPAPPASRGPAPHRLQRQPAVIAPHQLVHLHRRRAEDLRTAAPAPAPSAAASPSSVPVGRFCACANPSAKNTHPRRSCRRYVRDVVVGQGTIFGTGSRDVLHGEILE